MWFRHNYADGHFEINKSVLGSAVVEFTVQIDSHSIGVEVYDSDTPPYHDVSYSRVALYLIRTAAGGKANTWAPNVWYMALLRYNDSSERALCDVWQGLTTTGELPDRAVLWEESDEFGRHYSDHHKGISDAFNGAFNGTGTFNIGRRRDNYYTSAGIDCIGFWKRHLLTSEGFDLYNQGQGLEYPFFLPTHQKWEQAPGPVIVPTPSSLYAGTSWNVGETPVTPPAPDAGWLRQPTLPAWRVAPRIQGWTYDNNFPRPASEPLVSQWWLQASEPVRNEDETAARLVSLMSPASNQETYVDPVIPDPPLPPEPPVTDSEALTDDIYRPGRADSDESRYRRP